MYYLVGKIVGTHGIKGEVKVINESSFERFIKGNTLYIDFNNEYKAINIDSVRIHKGMYLIAFNGIDNINDVLEYVGKNIYTTEHDRLDDNHYYYDDLIGSIVYNQNNEKIGIVNDIIENPTQEVLEIDTGEKKVLIPFVNAFVKKVDIIKKEIYVEVIEGLI